MALGSGSSSRRSSRAHFPLGNANGPAAIVLLLLLLSAGCSDWRGPGFRPSGPELPRLRHVLALQPGMSVADVGAGKGELTLALAAEVGPSGRVYSTEIDPESLEQIRAAVGAARLANVTVVEAQARETGLPASCCDAIVLRRVYHHLTDPAPTNASLLRALRPGGLLAVIDFPPLLSWLWPWPPAGVPRNRGGHGADARLVAEEVVASRFELVQVIEDWPGRGPLASYCAVFRKPGDSQPGRLKRAPTSRTAEPARVSRIETWRTGDQGLAPMTFARASVEPTGRLWIDTDAACGHSARTDPDDCLAIALLARAAGDRIAGISTVAGNAPLEVVERTTGELATLLSAELGRTLPVRTGTQGLTAALEEGPLTVVALGPLTNLAAVLDARPELRSRVARVVAVMGRRPGHLFHPAEGAAGGMLFGHGPIFRDFNFEMDVTAATRTVALGVPLTLVPYDAARRVEISAPDLDRLAAAGGAAAWVAKRSRDWLAYWRRDIGRQGFSPFDLLAAAYVVEPQQVACAEVQVWVGEDSTLFILFRRPSALLVGQGAAHPGTARARGTARYCADVSGGIKPWLVDRLAR